MTRVQNAPETPAKPYKKPTLRVYGPVGELTLGVRSIGQPDNSPRGTATQA
jgi:hypothetical protein